MANSPPRRPKPPNSGSSASTAPGDGWAAIKVNDVVLATEGVGEGWYEAVVTETKGETHVSLKWRDWKDEPEFFRPRDELALLPPGYKDAKARKRG